jgi:hydrogenase maturation factor
LEEFCQLEENIAKYCTLLCIDSINDISEGQMVLVDCQETYGMVTAAMIEYLTG